MGKRGAGWLPHGDFRATLLDGPTTTVDSSEMALKVAASMAYKSGCAKAKPTILEPIMAVECATPEEHLGDVISDFGARMGHVEGIEDRPGSKVVKAPRTLAFYVRVRDDAALHDEGRRHTPCNLPLSGYPRLIQEELVEKVRGSRK